MTKLVLVSVCLVLVGVYAEPPSSYFPPQARNSPSSQYGAPQQQSRFGGFGGQRSSGRSFSYNSLAENQFGGSSRSSGNSRGRFSSPSQQYGAPSARQQPSQQYGAPSARQQPSQQYGAPARQQPSQQYGAPSFDDSIEVSAASRFNNQGRNGFSRQQPQYNAPSYSRQQQPSSSYSAPAPRNQPSSQYGAPSTEYGAPFGRKMSDDDLSEPANYEYNYEVQAAEESGAEFGHQETREDDRAQGEYHVLLPDGRMQIVEYEADEEGFRPKIRYEETGYPDSRDNQGPY